MLRCLLDVHFYGVSGFASLGALPKLARVDQISWPLLIPFDFNFKDS